MIQPVMERDPPSPNIKSGKADKPPAKAMKTAEPVARPFQRRRGGDAKSISDLMPEIGRTAFRRFGFVQSSVVSRWPEIAGERYAALSRPESIAFPRNKKAEGTLHLVVSGASAVLMQHVAPELIERVNRFFGYRAVAQIKFRQGAMPQTARPQPTPPARPLRPIPVELGDSLRDIGDPELLTVLQSLARSLDDEGMAASPNRSSPGNGQGDQMSGNVKPIGTSRSAPGTYGRKSDEEDTQI